MTTRLFVSLALRPHPKPVIKYFPGLGSATGNTDFIASTTDQLSALTAHYLDTYRQLSSLHPDFMVGGIIVPDLTDGQPALWSRSAAHLLCRIGYQDVVTYNDSLTARAVPGSLEDAVVKSWLADIYVAVIV